MDQITQFSQFDQNKQYSYEDYIGWKFENRVEIIKGKVFVLPSPDAAHIKTSVALAKLVFKFLTDSRHEAYAVPFDVCLFDRVKTPNGYKVIYTVLQPDLIVITDLEKLDRGGCLGAPDRVVEILLPGNASRQ